MHNYLIDFLILIFFSVINYFLLKKSLPQLKKYFPASPSTRGMHNLIKPSSGGVSFILIFNIFSIIKGYYLPIFSLPIAVIGIIDDKFNISRLLRYFFQIITLLFITLSIVNNSNLFISKLIEFNPFYIFIVLFIGSIIINSINFMDGIDGLIAGSMIIIFTTLNFNQNYDLVVIIGSLLGFLFLNWYPSKVFMGDSGSLFLGSYLTSLIISTESFIEIIKIIFLCSPLLLDAIICIFRRLLNQQNIFKPHKLHLYQRLVLNGINHANVTKIYLSSIFFLSIFYLFSNIFYFSFAVLLIFIFGIYLDKNFAIKFN